MVRLPLLLAVLCVLACAALAAEEVNRDAQSPELEEKKKLNIQQLRELLAKATEEENSEVSVARTSEECDGIYDLIKGDIYDCILLSYFERTCPDMNIDAYVPEDYQEDCDECDDWFCGERREKDQLAQLSETRKGRENPQAWMARKRNSKILPEAKRNMKGIPGDFLQRREKFPLRSLRRHGNKRSFPNQKKGNPTKNTMVLKNLLRQFKEKKPEQ